MNRLLGFILMFVAVFAAAKAEDSQLEERLNPDFESAEAINYNSFPSVHLDKNKVALNGDDWSTLAAKYQAALAGKSLFSIVYLGDSHIQADFGGSVLRSRLSAGHSAGRGLIIPFKLAGTNQPLDYSINTSSPFMASKMMRLPWNSEMPFTGIGIRPTDKSFELSIKAEAPTSKLRFHITGGTLSAPAHQASTDTDGLLCIALESDTCTAAHIKLEGDGATTIGGIELLSDSTGILLHSIGNNGATYSDYSLPPHFGSELARLHPDLIIIALGTNEAFGNVSTESLRNNAENLVNTIRRHNPRAHLLIVGPAECYRRKYRRSRRSNAQIVNTKVATVARTIRLFAENNKIPYYNHFAIAGNAPSQRRAGLLRRDGVHYTIGGYQLWGNLLADAILEHLHP